MSVSNPSNKNVFIGDGSLTVFPYTFQLPVGSTGSDILLFVVDPTGVITQLTSNFTINLFAATVTYPNVGGVAPLGVGVNALPPGWNLVVIRIEQLVQTLTLLTQGVWDGPTITAAFDNLQFQIQQLQEQLSRAYTAPINTTLAPTTLAAFIAAISTVFPPFSTDTYANLKVLSAGTPTVKRWGMGTDLNGGQGQLCFYTAVPTSGDAGWFLIPIEFFG